jgi:HSP20 family protein
MFSLTPWTRDRNPSTAVVERDPFRLMRREFDSLFDRLWGNWPFGLSEYGPRTAWGLDVQDHGNELVVRAEAPGFEAKEFDVTLSGDMLTITAEHKEETKNGEETSQSWGRYERAVSLPCGVDPDKVEAKYRNGVLEVHLPKTADAVGRRIEVKT